MHEEDMQLIKELGANTIRLAHYQHDQYFYDLCDEAGMVVWAEIPYISEHMNNGRENTISQMKELIVQNYNHACIVCWGVSNEITISTKDKRDMLDNHRVLNDLCHEMDKTRLTTLACYAMCGPFNPVAHITDPVSYTHLDVYKRQRFTIRPSSTRCTSRCAARISTTRPPLAASAWRSST